LFLNNFCKQRSGISGAILAVIIFISDYSYIMQTPAEHYKFKRSAGWHSYFHIAA